MSQPKTRTAKLFEEKLAIERLTSGKLTTDNCSNKRDKKSKRKSKKITKLLILFLCTIGLIYHLTITTIEYLSYEMITLTTIELPDFIEPPAISLCLELMDFKQLPTNCTREEFDSKNRCSLNYYSLNELMNQYSGNLTSELQFINHEKGKHNKFYDKDDVHNQYYQSRTLTYYHSGFKCIRIPSGMFINHTSINQDTIIERRRLEHYSKDKFVLEFTIDVQSSLNFTISSSNPGWACVTLFFHESDKIVHKYDQPSVWYFWQPTVEPNVAQLNYYQITTKYLKYPFSHNCYDYSVDSKLESKGDCIEKCTKDGIIKKYGKVGRVTSTYEYDNYFPHDGPTFDEDIDKYCVKKCPLHCNTIIYNPILALLWTSHVKEIFRIQLSPTYPTTYVTYIAKFDMLSYLIYIGGIFGIWVGMSVFTSTSFLINYVMKFCANSIN